MKNEFNTCRAAIRVRSLAIGLLAALAGAQAQAQTPADPFSYSRASDFEYNATNGFLSAEIVEPTTLNACVRTTYGRDNYGNVTSAITANCSGAAGRALFAARRTVTTYSSFSISLQNAAGTSVSVTVPAGTFPRTVRRDDSVGTTINGRTHQETRTFDPRFGGVTRLTSPNSQNTDWQYDDFGRKIRETRVDGTYTQILYCIIEERGLETSSNLPSGALTCPIGVPPDAPDDAVQFVHAQAYDKVNAAMGPYVRTYTDRLGREIRTVTQSFDGNGQTAGLIYQDVVYNQFGAKVATTEPYFATTQSSTIDNPSAFGRTVTEYDVLGRVTKVYVADPAGTGDLPPVDTILLNGRFANASLKAALTTTSYSALDVETTNARGQTMRQEKNPEGKVVRTTDALGAQVAYRFDAFGNLRDTVDGVGNATRAEFDVRGRRTRLVDPNTGDWRYDYNALGELRWQQSPNERAAGDVATTMDYDVLGRMTTRTTPFLSGYTTTWTYDRYLDGTTCNRCIGKATEVATTHGVARRFTFDTTGRPTSTRTTLSGGPGGGGASRVYTASQTYVTNKSWINTQTYPSGVAVKYNYTNLGFMQRLTNNAGGATLWQAQRVNAWGKLEQQQAGNGVQTRTEYQSATGRVLGIDAGVGAASSVLSHDYGWDVVGNLTSRIDNNGNGSSGAVIESFRYDAINRLYEYTVGNPAIPNGTRTVTVTFNAGGSVLAKSDVGTLAYPANGAQRPHAVQTVRPLNGGATTYEYDLNGNLWRAQSSGTEPGDAVKYSQITYTSFNLPDSSGGALGANGTRYMWHYDENHGRIKEDKASAAGTRQTWYLHPDKAGGLSFEQELAENGSWTNRHFLTAGGGVIGVLITQGDTWVNGAQVNRTTIVRSEYWHKDHLGSTAAVTDVNGSSNVTRYAYDPWGKRRFTTGTYDAFGTLVIEFTAGNSDRGFTGHEHLDDIGIIHMNGRLYDAHIGRFLQADPHVQEVLLLQNFNRYSYVLNNPLNATDPSGEFVEWIAYAIVMAMSAYSANQVAMMVGSPELGMILSIGVGVMSGPLGGAMGIGQGIGQAAVAGFAMGAGASGGLKGGLRGMATAVAFYGAGRIADGLQNSYGEAGVAAMDAHDFAGAKGAFAASNAFASDGIGRAILHGAAGCASSAISGGDCGKGAVSAGLTKYASASVLVAWDDHRVLGVAKYAVIGGTISRIGGDKFANGAMTGAFQYLFNQTFSSARRGCVPNAAGNVDACWRQSESTNEERQKLQATISSVSDSVSSYSGAICTVCVASLSMPASSPVAAPCAGYFCWISAGTKALSVFTQPQVNPVVLGADVFISAGPAVLAPSGSPPAWQIGVAIGFELAKPVVLRELGSVVTAPPRK